MSKKIILLSISILLIIFLIGYLFICPAKHTSVQTKYYSLVDFQQLTDDSSHGVLSINLTFELPVRYRNKKVLDSIQSQIITRMFGSSYLQTSSDSLLRQFSQELKSEYIENNRMMAEHVDSSDLNLFNYAFSIEGFALLNDKHIFTYGIARNVDFGGNHPTQTRFFYNFDLASGKIITESDLFIPDSLDQLSHLLREEVKRMSRENDEMPTIDTYAKSVYEKNAIRPNGNFYINDQGICYVFNP